MKSFFSILVSFCVLLFTSNAQIVLEASELAPVGSSFDYITAYPSSFTFDTTANQWDFTALTSSSEAYFSVVDWAEAYENGVFPDADYIVKIQRKQEIVYSFNKLTADALTELGYAGYIPSASFVQRYIIPGTTFVLPLHYQDRYCSLIESRDTNTDNNYIFQRVKIDSFSVCGYGTVKVPVGDFSSLLIRRLSTRIDTTWDLSGNLLGTNISKRLEYMFITDDAAVRFLVAQLYYGEDDVLDSIDILKQSYVATGIDENVAFSVYPNPVGEYFVVGGLSGNYSMFVYSVSGKLVKMIVADGSGYVYAGDLKPGVYFVSIVSNGKYLTGVRFIKK